MISITKLSGRSVLAPCFAGVSMDSGTTLSSASLCPGSVQGLRKPDSGLRGLISERPSQAPAAAAAQAYAYAYAPAAANSAEAGPEWASFTTRHATAVTQQHHMMRAFRGLEPWRDPA